MSASLAPRVRERNERLPLSFAQTQMLGLELRGPPGRYNLMAINAFPRHVQVDDVYRSLAYIADRHESLRTRFGTDVLPAHQAVAGSVEVQLKVTDLTRMSLEECEASLREMITEERRGAFDLSVQPLFRSHLFRLADGNDIVVSVFDHLVCDAASLEIFRGELSMAHSAIAGGRLPDLPKLPVQYGDFVLFQRARCDTNGGELLDAQLDYWKRALLGARLGPALPFDRSPPILTKRVLERRITLPSQAYRAIRSVARESRSSVFIVSLAVAVAVLSRLGELEDVMLSTTVSGRSHANLSGVIGMFAGPSRLRVDLSGDPSFESVVERTRRCVLGMLSHQDVPFQRVRNVVWPEFPTSEFEVPFALPTEFGYFPVGPKAGGTELTVLGLPAHEFAATGQVHPLSVRFQDDGTELSGVVSHKVDFYRTGTVERLAVSLDRMLTGVDGYRGVTLSQLPFSGL